MRTVFCVQTFKRAGRALQPCALIPFESAVEAEEVGERLSGRHDGVLVYAMDCDPEHEIWSEPELFAAHGQVPRLY